ncbi:MAG: N-acetyl-gamma-glutamyl-phosphate reductase [Woeseiaceae bacterium]
MAIDAVVLGATGYVGGELLRLIQGHPQFRLMAAVSESRAGERIAKVFPHLSGAYPKQVFAKRGAWAANLDRGSNLALFSCAPHGASAALVAEALATAAEYDLTVHAVDSSADFRYASAAAYREVYGVEHGAPQLLPHFLCAVPELAGAVNAKHVGHPGCFATAILLAAVPLVASGIAENAFFVCGTTGSTGAGRAAQDGTHHPERHSNLYAYKALSHRHVPEIERLVFDTCRQDVNIHFVPHSGPFARGIYVTLQAKCKSHTTESALQQVFHEYYENCDFVHVVDGAPKLKNVVASNDCHLGVAAADGTVVVLCAIDNLVKGAAGGALQWMNRLWSLPESTGLTAPAPAWT